MPDATGAGRRRAGVSLIEIVIGALILGISGVTVIELVRSNTVNLQLTEIQSVARGLAADLVERFSQPSVHDLPGVQRNTSVVLGARARWDLLLGDPAFNHGFPKDQLSKILEEYGVMFTVDIKPFPHGTFGPRNQMTHVSVTVHWQDLGPNAARNPSGDYKSVTYGCLVDR